MTTSNLEEREQRLPKKMKENIHSKKMVQTPVGVFIETTLLKLKLFDGLTENLNVKLIVCALIVGLFGSLPHQIKWIFYTIFVFGLDVDSVLFANDGLAQFPFLPFSQSPRSQVGFLATCMWRVC